MKQDKPLLHTQLEQEIYDKLKGLLPDALVVVGFLHVTSDGFGAGPEVSITMQINRNNSILQCRQHIHTEYMPRDILARETAKHFLLNFYGALTE
jgi:hypothetical protein